MNTSFRSRKQGESFRSRTNDGIAALKGIKKRIFHSCLLGLRGSFTLPYLVDRDRDHSYQKNQNVESHRADADRTRALSMTRTIRFSCCGSWGRASSSCFLNTVPNGTLNPMMSFGKTVRFGARKIANSRIRIRNIDSTGRQEMRFDGTDSISTIFLAEAFEKGIRTWCSQRSEREKTLNKLLHSKKCIDYLSKAKIRTHGYRYWVRSANTCLHPLPHKILFFLSTTGFNV